MECKADNPVNLLDRIDLHPIIRAYFEFNQLKNLYRQGWLNRDVPKERCESVAEHTFGVAVLACFLANASYPHLDIGKVVSMALVHDFGEVYAGDITPRDGISPGEKHRRELDSINHRFASLPDGERYVALWQEYDAGQTPEAGFVRQVDSLEMGLQAAVYANQGFDNMSEFFESASRLLKDTQLQDLMTEVASLPSSHPD